MRSKNCAEGMSEFWETLVGGWNTVFVGNDRVEHWEGLGVLGVWCGDCEIWWVWCAGVKSSNLFKMAWRALSFLVLIFSMREERC